MTRLQLSSPFFLPLWDLVPVRKFVSLLAYARPVPAMVCIAVAGVFLFQGFRYLAKVRTETSQGGASAQRLRWLRGSMALGFLLAAAWIALLGLEIRYPDPPSPTHSTPAQDVRQ